jgi:TPP-dependent pyruvate/acetoin dehydrogenase alpha subunit
MASTGKTQIAATPAPAEAAERLSALHRTMVLLRVADEAASALARDGHVGVHVPASGTEGVLAGVASQLQAGDWALPGVRQAGIALARGASLEGWFAQLLGRSSDPTRGRQEPAHVAYSSLRVASVSTPPGSQLPHATGVARAIRMRRRPDVAVALCGSAAVATGDFHVALNFAALWQVPVLFVVATTPEALAAQTASESVAIKAGAYGMSGVTVDGLDVLAVERVVREALERARRDATPALVEARMEPRNRGLHVVDSTADPDDPLASFERELEARGLLDAPSARRVREEIGSDAARAVEHALALPPPPQLTLFEDVFARRTPELSRQRRAWLAARRPVSAPSTEP